ncbi:MAG: AAA family ATPase [Phenylobacterium sp.]|uniref:AAA family ATPase n=1 Tax=Phenylobacterium sp. TaxID=1871053 RepID=UPI00391B4308
MNINPGKTEFSDAEHVALVAQVKGVLSAEKISQADLARQADVPQATLSQYLNGTYPSEAGRASTAAKLTKWLRAREQAAEMRRQLPKAPAYMPLTGSRKIAMALTYARETGRMVMIAGSPGVSKTASARQFREDFPRTWYTAMDPSTGGVPTMLLEVLAAMGVSEIKGTPQQLMRRVCDIAVEAKGLIIVDEAQHLSEQAIEALRALNDRTRERGAPIGVALLGNETAWTRVGTTGGKAAFAQVSSRFAQRRWIVSPDPVDAAALARAWADANGEIISEAEVAYCVDIASRAGGLRNIEMTMEAALLAARGAGDALSLEHLKGAFAQLSGLGRTR